MTPTDTTDELLPLIGEALAAAMEKFNKKTAVKPAKRKA